MKKDFGIAHIAVAVKNLDEAVQQIEQALGLKASAPEVVEEQKVRLRFVDIGGVRFEFLEPTQPDSPISKFLEKRGNGIHHVALQVSSIEDRLSELQKKNVRLIDSKPKVGAEGCKIAFLHPASTAGILFELVEGESH